MNYSLRCPYTFQTLSVVSIVNKTLDIGDYDLT